MSVTDAVARVGQIDSQIAALQTAFDPPAQSAAVSAAGTAGSAPGSGSGSFADALSQAQQSGLTMGVNQAAGSGSLPPAAQSMLTSGQQQFASRLAADTGLDPRVVTAWLLAEESGGAAQSRQAAGNNDWLNIGYTDSGTYGSSDSIWSNPVTAADATAGWLKGQKTIPGYGTASSGIQAILQTAGQSPQAQVAALQQSGWASSGYPSLPSLLAQVGGS
jgi:hypothetical protein